MRKRLVIVMALVVALVATACYLPYDLIGDTRADRVYVDDDGAWRDADGTSPPLFTSPEGADWVVPGNYDGKGKWEAAATDGVNWYTAGEAGTIHFPFPEADLLDAVPVPANYDGDLPTEPAWWSRATATWYIQGKDPIVFGTPGTGVFSCIGTDPGDPLWQTCLTFLRSDIPVPADYDNDGVTELAVYNPVYGEWHFDETGESLKLGYTGDVPVVADFDGDGTQDPGVYDLRTGRWQVEGIGDLGVFGPQTGPSEFVYPIAADYTGDRVADLSYVDVSSPAGPTWHVQGREPVVLADASDSPLGLVGMPAAVLANLVRIAYIRQCSNDVCLHVFDTPYDFDGDGAADPAWVNAAGEWWWDDATSPLAAGSPGDVPVPGAYRRIGTIDLAAITPGSMWRLFNPTLDIGSAPPPPTSPDDRVWPVPADYDGDGLDEPAWYRDSDATWWIDGAPPVQFGIGGTDQLQGAHDVPVPGDYDGDRRAKLVVYRPTDGTFRSHGGGIIAAGLPMGIPAPGNYSSFSLHPGLEAAVYDPVDRGWWLEDMLATGETLGEAVAGIPVPARYRGGVNDSFGVVVPNGPTMEWRYVGPCCAVTVEITPVGTPLMARAAVLGAIPRLTYLANAS